MIHLQENKISHNILKNTNILVDGEGQVKLSYFNLESYYEKDNALPTNKNIDNKDSSKKVYFILDINYWIAPEIILNPSIKRENAADIWAVGSFVIEMATKQPPWSKQFPTTKELLNAMKKDKGNTFCLPSS